MAYLGSVDAGAKPDGFCTVEAGSYRLGLSAGELWTLMTQDVVDYYSTGGDGFLVREDDISQLMKIDRAEYGLKGGTPLNMNKLLQKGGKLWEKAGLKRVYFGDRLIMEHAGLKVKFYSNGNIAEAKLKGDAISNAEAKRIVDALRGAKFYYDLQDGQLHIKDTLGLLKGYKKEMVDDFFKMLKEMCEA